MNKYRRYEGETEDQLLFRIGNDKEKIGTWPEVACILNNLTGHNYDSSAWRKRYTSFQRMLDANKDKIITSKAQLNEIDEQKRELERLKIQFRDERNAWQKQNYIDARVEHKLDCLEEKLEELGKINFPFSSHKYQLLSGNDLIVQLSDLHIGQSFKSVWGEYDTDIAKERLEKYFNSILSIKQLHDSENCYVILQGDLISGNIHKQVQVTNRENVIDQIKIVSEMITSFCYGLSMYFNNVFIYNVSGNHSRIDRKEDALHDERLDDLVGWIVKKSLGHIDNIHVNTDHSVDIGICSINIRGLKYVAVHGDMDSFSRSGVQNLCTFLGYIPEAVLYGHFHHCSFDEENGIKMIRSGSLAGAGDNHTLEKRISGKPSQMVTVCTAKGVQCCYPIYF